jgi:hypothetical protein
MVARQAMPAARCDLWLPLSPRQLKQSTETDTLATGNGPRISVAPLLCALWIINLEDFAHAALQ